MFPPIHYACITACRKLEGAGGEGPVRDNRTKRIMLAGGLALGVSITIPDPFVAEVIGAAGSHTPPRPIRRRSPGRGGLRLRPHRPRAPPHRDRSAAGAADRAPDV